MRPTSLSATALQVAELCLARYEAEQLKRTRGIGGGAAGLGSAVHGALEIYVKKVHLLHEAPEDCGFLLDLFRMSYMDIFATGDAYGDVYDDGVEMLTKWFSRTDFSSFTVLSCEVKENFPVPTSIGELPLNYIWDRHDQLEEDVFRVVDYKTNRWGLRPEDLKNKIQARVYGLAAQIKHPQAKRIWVEFDLLRHDPVGTVFTRDDNIATWKFVKQTAERIIATPDGAAEETLNPECRFCVRILDCDAVTRNASVGGVFSIASAKDAIDKRAQLEYQKAAVVRAIEQIDEIILAEAKTTDVFEFESDQNRLNIIAGKTRTTDAERVEKVIGTELFELHGSRNITMGTIDKLLKSKELTEDQKKQLKGLIYYKMGEPRVKVTPRNPIDDD